MEIKTYKYNYICEWFGYDRNGNILHLIRGFNGTTVQDAAIVREGNRIVTVYDVSDDNRIGEVPQIASGDYPCAVDYDANGNRIRDDLRGIASVTYHEGTDLPSVMRFADGAKLQWGYRSDGTLTRLTTTTKPVRYVASVKENGDTVWRSRTVTSTYSHIGDFIRTNTNRWRLYHEAGHSDIDATGAVSHRYYIRDRLGSTRVVIDGDGRVLQATGYYPSGLPYAITTGEAETDRLHTGKQFIDHNGARLLDGIDYDWWGTVAVCDGNNGMC